MVKTINEAIEQMKTPTGSYTIDHVLDIIFDMLSIAFSTPFTKMCAMQKCYLILTVIADIHKCITSIQ